MRQHSLFETLLSAGVILVAVSFLVFANHSTNSVSLGQYDLTATMSNASGLAAGTSDVMLAGTKVGKVSNLSLDPKSWRAVVQMRLDDDVKIPADSTLSISSGLLSTQSYLSISPGRSSVMLAAGSVLTAK
jgi:phospholipid/cholesterol/gamma-HCH transport system substrate-binding protein